MRATLALLLLPPLALLFLLGSLLAGFSALLTPERTLAVLQESNALPTLYRYGLESFAKAPTGAENTNPLGLDNAGFAQLTERVVPAEQVTAWIQSGVPAFYEWLGSDETELAIPLDLTGVKARLGPAVYAVLEERASTVAECTPEERATMESGEITFCRLPGEPDAQLLTRVRSAGAVEQFVAKFPDTLTVPDFTPVGAALGTDVEPPPSSGGPAVQLRTVRTVYRNRGAIVASVWLVTGFLLLLQTLLHRSQHRRLLRWLGLSLLVMGALPLLLGVVGATGAFVPALTSRLPPEFPAAVRAALEQLIGTAAAELLRIPLLFGAIAVVSGMLGTVLSLLHPHPHRGEPTERGR